MAETEQIVFMNTDGTPTGEAGPKLASHTADTKLHLGFSCYIFRPKDHAFLLTQRAVSKKVWPGVWTNSVCGHPGPGEPVEKAVLRRAQYELGIKQLNDIRCVLPAYTYTTPPYNGIIENEFCPVFIAYTDDAVRPNPTEVEAYSWVTWPDYVDRLQTEKDSISYWAKDQYAQLRQLPVFAALLHRQ